MRQRFRDYTLTQLKKYLVMVVLITTSLFMLVSYVSLKVYSSRRIEHDLKEVVDLLQGDLDRLYREMSYINETYQDGVGELSSLYDLIYGSLSESRLKYNFTVLNKSKEILVTNLYTGNLETLLKSNEFHRALNQMELFDI